MDKVKFQEFQERYSSFSEEQLFYTHQKRLSLTEEAIAALEHVMAARHINIADLEDRNKRDIEEDIKNVETRNKNKKRNLLKNFLIFYVFLFVVLMIISPNNISRIELAISCVVTWSVILVPAFAIRYIRKGIPLKKWTAIAVAAVLYFINVIIFVSLGFTSNHHSALIIGAIICFHLLTIESLKSKSAKDLS